MSLYLNLVLGQWHLCMEYEHGNQIILMFLQTAELLTITMPKYLSVTYQSSTYEL